jgi:hypothetical protein
MPGHLPRVPGEGRADRLRRRPARRGPPAQPPHPQPAHPEHPAIEWVLRPRVTTPLALELPTRFGGPAGLRAAGRRRLLTVARTAAPGSASSRSRRCCAPLPPLGSWPPTLAWRRSPATAPFTNLSPRRRLDRTHGDTLHPRAIPPPGSTPGAGSPGRPRPPTRLTVLLSPPGSRGPDRVGATARRRNATGASDVPLRHG